MSGLILYIAGPMTGLPENNYPAFNDAEAALEAAGYRVLNPARTEGREDCVTWRDYMRASLRDIADCHGVALLPKWHTSQGADLEYDIAMRLDLPCRPLQAWIEDKR